LNNTSCSGSLLLLVADFAEPLRVLTQIAYLKNSTHAIEFSEITIEHNRVMLSVAV